MNIRHRFTALSLSLACLLSATPVTQAQDAASIASKLSEMRQDGTSYVRLRMQVNGGTLQLQTKERKTAGGSDVVYQILFPKERKGESVLLRKAPGRASSGAVFVPPDTVKTLDAGQMKDGLFGSALSYEDVMDNFFAWPQQTLIGPGEVGRTACQILESRPGKGDRSSYAAVRTWVDTKRMVPMRVEKYNASGGMVVRIETTNVEQDDLNRHLPAGLTVTRGGSSTVLEGSKIKHGVSLTESDFTPEGIKVLATPK